MNRPVNALTDRELETVKRVVRWADRFPADSGPSVGPREPLPTIGRASGTVAVDTIATFDLQQGPPFTDSGQTRAAYALSEFADNDLAVLKRVALPPDGGLWIANRAVTTSTPGMSPEEKECLCSILADINTELVAAGQSAVDLSCLCPGPTLLCPVVSQEIAVTLIATFTGATLDDVTEEPYQWAFDSLVPTEFPLTHHPGDSPCVRRVDDVLGGRHKRVSPPQDPREDATLLTLNVVDTGGSVFIWEAVLNMVAHYGTNPPGFSRNMQAVFRSAPLTDFTTAATLPFVSDDVVDGLEPLIWNFRSSTLNVTP